MKRKVLPSDPPEPPAWYRTYDPTMWARPEDMDDGDIWADYLAESRWSDAKREWRREHGVSGLAELRARRALRERAAGIERDLQ
jgi:hypothetical protein